VDQLAKDTEEVKAAEQQRNEKLNDALTELETVISELKSSNRRREDEAQRIRDDVQGLKDSIPKALDAQKTSSDTRLQEVNAELKSLKTIISQRMASQQPAANNYLNRPSAATPTPVASPATATAPASGNDTGANGTANGQVTANDTPNGGSSFQGNVSSTGRSSPFSSGIPAASVKIPEWQRAMATKRSSTSMATNSVADGGSGSASQAEAGGSSS
jgi:peroxin-14